MLPEIFGKKPAGQRLERIKRSPNYQNGEFQNISKTEMIPKDVSRFKLMKDFFSKPKS